MNAHPASAWSEAVTIPAYGIGEPNPNPMFLERRVYQGSSGAVYPYPVIDRVDNEKRDREWLALFLENRWLKIMILPELGGRVQMALDKTNGYHFVYYNRVIKPALVGLCGPWISGGIEFNWPQHHRPTTFSPVEWKIEQGGDGGVTVWCSEIEPMFGTRGTHGFRLYPDRAYLELDVRLYNRTSEPQTFLWWANPAVHVNDDYQSVFPPDVHAVMDHGKRAVSSFPIARGEYYKVDYAPGADITRYKNIPVPTSYMAYHSDYDFIGCYDHGKRAGMLHVADHHLVPGKKQWTWGNGDFGRSWDRQLTDEDGPYIELMCGAFTDNQPDFSWLMPGEEKRFTQTFMPYKEIGPACNASREAVIAFELNGGTASLGLHTARHGQYTVQLWSDDTPPERVHNHKNMDLPAVRRMLSRDAQLRYTKSVALGPESAWQAEIELRETVAPHHLTMRVLDATGRPILEFTPAGGEIPALPPPAAAAPEPTVIESVEELYLNGLHLEQYRHATRAPEAYYEEALRRDPGDSRCNNAIGLLLLRRGRFADAEPFFRRAIARLTSRNPNPPDGEPYYHLGLCLRLRERLEDARDAFCKALWNEAWKAPAAFELARLALREGNAAEALAFLNTALVRNAHHHKARHLRVLTLRRLGREDDARAEAELSLDLDPFNAGVLFELERLGAGADLETVLGGKAYNFIQLALDYAHAGAYDEGLMALDRAPAGDPMAPFFAGWIETRRGNVSAAVDRFRRASALPRDFLFPNALESVPALRAAMRLLGEAASAPYALGNFWYSRRQYDEAIACWETAARIDPAFPTAWRNLGLAYMNKRADPAAAQRALETAFSLDPADARVFFELDQLRKRRNVAPRERLAALEQHAEPTAARDDLTIERIALLNLLGRHEEALHLLSARNFHPWEGGEGKVTAQYVVSLLQLARRDLQTGQPDAALAKLERARNYPPNLGEGKLPGCRENHLDYWSGRALLARGDIDEARLHFQRAARGSIRPDSAMYYNDQPPETIFYQGLAVRMLEDADRARAIFAGLVEYGRRHIDDTISMDYFAVSLPDFLVFDADLQRSHQVHCRFLMALGHLGLGEAADARRELDAVLALQADHLGAHLHADIDAFLSSDRPA